MKLIYTSKRLFSGCSSIACANSTSYYAHAPVEPKNYLRIGDRAAVRAHLYRFRAQNPDVYIIYIESRLPHFPSSFLDISPEWLVGDLVDEIWVLESELDRPEIPSCSLSIIKRCLWWDNKTVNEQFEVSCPVLPPQTIDIALPEKYICLNPVLDRPYDLSRNFPFSWWQSLGEALSSLMPVVIIGDWTQEFIWPSIFCNATHIPIFQSLTIIKKAHAFVGGNSGPTHWSGLLGTPTFAVYPENQMYPVFVTDITVGDPDYSPRHKSTPILTVAFQDDYLVIAQRFKEFLHEQEASGRFSHF